MWENTKKREIEDEEVKIIHKYPSLLKYEAPRLVTDKEKEVKFKTAATDNATFHFYPLETIDRTMDRILPPLCWVQNGQSYRQNVSCKPTTPDDAGRLDRLLDLRLKQTGARGIGICPIRRALYKQCVDEIIRQQTLSCVDRGLLLLRLRDEIFITFDAYEKLYCSCVGYGLRKALQADRQEAHLKQLVQKLEKENNRYQSMIKRFSQKNLDNKARNKEISKEIEHKYALEITYVTKLNSQLKSILRDIVYNVRV